MRPHASPSQTRCAAVEALHHAVLDIADPGQVLPSLGEALQLLVGLLDDPNFKVGGWGWGGGGVGGRTGGAAHHL
jgi:hypothetical protein